MNARIAATLAVLLAAAPALAQTAAPERSRTVGGDRATARPRPVLYQRGSVEQTEQVTRTLKIGDSGELELRNLAGDITITRGGGNEVRVEAVKTARARTAEDAKEMLSLVTLEFAERGSRAEVRSRYPDGPRESRGVRRNISVTVAYTVTAPAGTRVTVRSLAGGIKVTDIRGELSLETVSGGIDIQGAGRAVRAKATSGGVTITGSDVEGLVNVGAVSGNVTVRKVKATRIDAESLSGSVTIEDVEADRVEAGSMSGHVQFTGALARGGRYELSSHSGNVRFASSGNVGLDLEATTFSGSVRSDLDVSMRASDDDHENERGPRRNLRGVVGDGSAAVRLTSFSGAVIVTRR